MISRLHTQAIDGRILRRMDTYSNPFETRDILDHVRCDLVAHYSPLFWDTSQLWGGIDFAKLADPFVNQPPVSVQPSKLIQRHEDSRSLAEVHPKPEKEEAKFIVDPNVQTTQLLHQHQTIKSAKRRGSEDLRKLGSGLWEGRSCMGIGQ